MSYAAGLLLALAVLQAWVCLWRLSIALRTLLPLEDRITRLSHSVAMLTDATEGCFKVVSSQLTATAAASDGAPTARRQSRQRRVVGAARRGRSIKQIAAQEEVAEGEVALRVQLARDLHAR
jgi:hypothetical protein